MRYSHNNNRSSKVLSILILQIVAAESDFATPTTTPSTCENFRCFQGLTCVMLNGVATCVQQQQQGSCNNYQCQQGFQCQLVNGNPTCIQQQQGSCNNYQCQQGFQCQLINGNPTCVPNQPPKDLCSLVICQPGSQCIMTNGRPQCILSQPPQDLCSLVQCQEGAKCVLTNGRPSCVFVRNSCDGVRCEEGSRCVLINGAVQCIKEDHPKSCSELKCSGKTPKCILLNGVPTCIAISPTPDPTTCTLPCPLGKKCVIVRGKQTCIEKEPPPHPPLTCDRINCPPGLICQVIANYSITCVPEFNTAVTTSGLGSITPTCDQITCTKGACVMVNYQPQCILNLPTCDTVICQRGHTCFVSKSGATCIATMKPPNPPPACCKATCCPEDMFCIELNDQPKCIYANPPPRPGGSGPCRSVKCPPGMACANVQGEPMCTYVTDRTICKDVECPSGMQCVSVNYEPMCTYVITGGTGTISGSPTGASGHFGCKSDAQCPTHQKCVNVNGLLQCVALPSKQICGNVMCMEPQFCSNVNGAPVCVTESSTALCRDMNCPDPSVCAVKDNVAKCVFLSDYHENQGGGLCAAVLCNAPAVCVEFNNMAMCRYPAAGFRKGVQQIADGYILELPSQRNKIPMTIYSKPSECDSVACELWNATCIMLDGTAYCARGGEGQFSDPNSPHCPLISCPSDTTCREHNGIPYCVKVNPCKTFRCPNDQSCRVNEDNEPYCASQNASGCTGITCSKGYQCHDGKCYRDCSTFDCPSRFHKCIMVNGAKK
ncbi:hypothetical protein PPL_11762 [Heterostelium album PN500]|uniref:Follistatin-like domain-containing protein n=1 Tax=Heterostelium pallidum (strain ATCC 26659 / Pp 5 / PN500) TaxID=670386 RepID=D3BUE3_HETP5|nr:hypothetical protein PPL_11762 [Heterostelium album PN500]EFA74731.1 hypothetical protein PPL_11762 [Heterostelium album PN500]|eukprot:XP_020426865.1 hypothetical protein PPL_11762 [Heterostelium album PN500]